MGYRKPIILFLLLLLAGILTTTKSDDGAAMQDIQKSLTPPPSGWSSPDYCKWKGITCDTSKRVTSISLYNQKLKGSLSPNSLSSLTSLQTLSLQGNSLTGPLPSLSNLSLLQEVYLDGNNFTSIPPKCFQGLTSLQVLSIEENVNLAPWVLPLELTDSGSLVKLIAGSCKVFGEIPDFFGKFPNLQDVRLSYNNLTGVLPRSLGKSQIQNFWVNNQDVGLSGSIEVLGGMSMVSQVWLHKNLFTGPIPDLSKCENLFDLNLRDNQLTGVVPASLVELKSLKNVSLGNNELQGPVPVFRDDVKVDWGNTNSFCRKDPGPCDPQVMTLLEVAAGFGYPIKLAESWQGNDACSGWTSVVCDSQKKNVVTVNLQNQHFGGRISPAFANLTSLRILYLNGNNLTGTIPESLSTLPNLQVLDVSDNDLSGKPPKFQPMVKLNTDGNPNIGKDIPTGGGDGGSGGGGSGDSPSTKGSKVSTGMIVGLVIAAVVFVLAVFIVYRCCTKGLHKKFGKVSNPESGSDVVKNGTVNNTNGYGAVPNELQSQSSGDHYNELYMSEGGKVAISIQVLRQATNDFSEENVLGRGGFGVVYKGELHDGTKVAVKRMEFVQMGSAKGMNEFQAEIAVLTKVRHRHLVALLGYCINGSERLLVYEYMPQGDLTVHLFDWREHGYSPLTWTQRVTIALDVARGVEYLHSLAQQSFIHRDLKPSNILLGNDMRAKVADFGLVKSAPDGKYSVETRLAGTFGYLAPEYADVLFDFVSTPTGRVTTKVDVYAFGIILMELITGRKALDDTVPDERSHLVTWFRRIMVNKENIPKAIDETLQPLDEDTLSSIYRVAELAGHYTAREPYQRPDMGHAVNILSPLVEQWKPASQEEEENMGLDFQMSLPQALERWQANEGTSTMYGLSYNETQSSIPSKPSGMKDTLSSTDGR